MFAKVIDRRTSWQKLYKLVTCAVSIKTHVMAYLVICLCMHYVPVNNFSHVGTLTCLPGLNGSQQRIKCLAQGDNLVPLVSLEPATHRPKI